MARQTALGIIFIRIYSGCSHYLPHSIYTILGVAGSWTLVEAKNTFYVEILSPFPSSSSQTSSEAQRKKKTPFTLKALLWRDSP